jgi:hypothetical protein
VLTLAWIPIDAYTIRWPYWGDVMMGRVAVAGLFAAPALRPGHCRASMQRWKSRSWWAGNPGPRTTAATPGVHGCRRFLMRAAPRSPIQWRRNRVGIGPGDFPQCACSSEITTLKL